MLYFDKVEPDRLKPHRLETIGLWCSVRHAQGASKCPAHNPAPRGFARAAAARSVALAVAAGHGPTLLDRPKPGVMICDANPALEIVARAHSDDEVDHLGTHGANIIIMGEREIARAMIERAVGSRPPPAADRPAPPLGLDQRPL